MIEKQRWTEKCVAKTFEGAADSFAKRMAEEAILQSRKHLEAVIDRRLQSGE